MNADSIRFIEETGIPIVSMFVFLIILYKFSCSENQDVWVLRMAACVCLLAAAIGFATGELPQKSGSLGPIGGPFAYVASTILLLIGLYILRKLP